MIHRNIFVGLIALVLLIAANVYGDTFPESSDTILMKWANTYNKVSRDPRHDSLEYFLKWIKDPKNKYGLVVGSFSFGFNGNDAELSDRYSVNASASVTRNSYPHETRFTLESKVTMDNDKLEEDVKTLRVNQDYDVTNYFELFGFGELFSDEFMSIDQRYEVGVGFKLQRQIWNEHAQLKELSAAVDYIDVVIRWASRMGSLLPDSTDSISSLMKEIEHLQTARDVAKRNFEFARRQKRYLSLAFSTALVADLERPAELAVTVVDTNGGVSDTSTVKLKPRDHFRYRLNVRPSMRWQATKMLSFYFQSIFKFPIVNDWYIHDLRIDTVLSAKLKASEKIGVVTKFTQYFDNKPPALSGSQLMRFSTKDIYKNEAPKRHSQFVLSIEYSF